MVFAVAGVAEVAAADMFHDRHRWRPGSVALPEALYEGQGIVALILPNEIPDLRQEAIRQLV